MLERFRRKGMRWLSLVEFRFDPDAPVIVLTPTITGRNGVKKKISMALDTGATYTMIPWEMAEVLGYEPGLSKERTDMITASGVETVPLLSLESISVLGKTVKGIEVVVHNLPQRSYVDGLLGLSFLRKFNICLDFKNGVLRIEG